METTQKCPARANILSAIKCDGGWNMRGDADDDDQIACFLPLALANDSAMA